MAVFDFGTNWQDFSARKLDEQRLADAAASLRALLQRDRLDGMSFLDIGCGSGLFSIAASVLGAIPVVGIDLNQKCILASERNRQALGASTHITFHEMSVLDPKALGSLGQFNIVYAWGSLHHTGAMWQAIEHTAERVTPGGTLVLAIYNQHVTSPVWVRIKRFYNWLPAIGQYTMALFFAGMIYGAKWLVTRRNPFKKERGMDFWVDVVDWIGGYPYEYADPGEVEAFVEGLGFTLRMLVPAQVPTGCNEFVFERITG